MIQRFVVEFVIVMSTEASGRFEYTTGVGTHMADEI